MKALISFAVKHAVSTLMIVLAIVICALISLVTITVDYLPKISSKYLLVSAEFKGIPATEMRKLVTIPIEDSFASLKGIKNCESVTRDGISLVQIELHWGINIETALTESRGIIDVCYETLPTGCSKPDVRIHETSKRNTVTIAVEPLDGDMVYCRYLSETDFKQRFQHVDGVAEVNIIGGDKQELCILVDKSKLEGKHMSLSDISNRISETNFEYPAGTMNEGEKEILFKTSGLYKSKDEILSTPVMINENGMVLLRDIAAAEFKNKRKTTFFLHNNKETVSIGIRKKSDASPIAVSHAVRAELDMLNEQYGSHYRFSLISDLSYEIKQSLFMLILSAVVGIIITFVILRIFFKSLKFSLVTASIIPLCILFSILALSVCERSINILSLSGIAVGLGMVIDPSTIVLENIQKRYREFPNADYKDIVVQATSSVSVSSIGSSLTTIIVFIPFFFLNGLLGELFCDMAIAVISSILFSCILSLTYTPSLFYLLTVKNKKLPTGISLSRIELWYSSRLKHIFCNKKLVLLIFASCIIIGTATFYMLRTEFLPTTRSETICVRIHFPYGTTISRIEKSAYELTSYIEHNKCFTSSSVEGGLDTTNFTALMDPTCISESIVVTCNVTDVEIARQVLSEFLTSSQLDYAFEENNDLLSSLLTYDSSTMLIVDDSPEKVRSKAETLLQKKVPFVPDVVVCEKVFSPDRSACARFSVSALNTAQAAQAYLEGVAAAPLYQNGREIPIEIKLNDSDGKYDSDIENIVILLDSSTIPLKVLGHFSDEYNEKILYRYNRKDAKSFQSNGGQSISDNTFISIGSNQIEELFANTGILLLIILFLIYCTMGVQFESFVLPLLILLAIPPAFSGAFLFLFLTKQSINVNSVIALVVLFGTAVNNAIILYEALSETKKLTTHKAIELCTGKIRAILITTLTSICALIPFAIDPFHLNAQSSMAVAIIGGLIVSLIIVMFTIPLFLYKYLSRSEQNE